MMTMTMRDCGKTFLITSGLLMFGGESLTSFVPEVGVQETMKEHGKDPLWKIR